MSSCLDYERGPIRPPSESRSLFLRIMRNCPWNRCTFCPVYKGEVFSVRSCEELFADIEVLAAMREAVRERAQDHDPHLGLPRSVALDMLRTPRLPEAFRSFILWATIPSGNVFLQDADALVMKTDDLCRVLDRLRITLPIGRITSYSRASTAARLGKRLIALRETGLARIHLGVESGDPETLLRVEKGATPERFIEAAERIREAGLELSVYVMPGLGGTERWREHAIATAELVRAMSPDTIRLRTLAIAAATPLFETVRSGRLTPQRDMATLEEIRLFLNHLDGWMGEIESDHVLNLLPELRGRMPEDQPAMIELLDTALSLDPENQTLYVAGRRAGVFRDLTELKDPWKRAAVAGLLAEWRNERIDPEEAIREIMGRFL